MSSGAMGALALMTIVMLCGLIVVGHYDNADAEAELRLYCEMQQIHIDSGGEFGWPDFRGLRHLCEF